jgi:hypothetical protein
MRAIKILPALILLAAALVAGCGSEGSDTGTTAPGETPGATTSTGEAEIPGGTPPGADIEVCRKPGGGVLGLRATGLGCRTAKRVAHGWVEDPECRPGGGESRSACSIDGYRCQAVAAGQGISISCARPGRSVAFIVAS